MHFENTAKWCPEEWRHLCIPLLWAPDPSEESGSIPALSLSHSFRLHALGTGSNPSQFLEITASMVQFEHTYDVYAICTPVNR